MSFFISDAMAEGGAAAQDPGLMGFLPLIVIFVIFYFLLIRPQVKRAKDHKKLIDSVNKGDEVVTSGGLVGKVEEVTENFVRLKIADNVVINVQRHAVASLLPKGSLE